MVGVPPRAREELAGPGARLKLVLLGHPVAHSLSPAMMQAALCAAGLEGTYRAVDVAPPLEQRTLDALAAENVHGANVTVPHKEAALALAAESTETAREIGAANVLTRGERGWRADNTDGPGFAAWLRKLAAARARVPRAVVLGAGGSARAVVWALLQEGAEQVLIVNRTRARAADLARTFGSRVVPGGPHEIPEDALVVHCTSLGLHAHDPLPLDAAVLARAGAVLDLVYPETPLVRAARERGIPSHDGLGLLVEQGALAFRAWTGRTADAEAMHAGARAELQRRAQSPRS